MGNVTYSLFWTYLKTSWIKKFKIICNYHPNYICTLHYKKWSIYDKEKDCWEKISLRILSHLTHSETKGSGGLAQLRVESSPLVCHKQAWVGFSFLTLPGRGLSCPSVVIGGASSSPPCAGRWRLMWRGWVGQSLLTLPPLHALLP